jgi:Rhodopirellula transposase DDE domain
VTDLLGLVEEQAGGDPARARQWVRRSVPKLSADLRRRGHRASPSTVRRLLRQHGYSPKANRKRFTGPRHPDRDRQFRHIARRSKAFLAAGLPVISVDTKKKELVGNFKSPGRSWCRQPPEVNAHDFKDDAVGKAVPYGLYVVNDGRGFVEVGTSADTAQFAVDVIAGWWQRRGRKDFPRADELLIVCDAGGSNSCSTRLWKVGLQERLADRFGLKVTVCHYPRGASKYNPVERRLFSPISRNWEGRPLLSYPVLLACIRGARTRAGLPVQARLNRRRYKTKIKVPDWQMRALNLERHKTCPRWNYTIKPRQPNHNS